MNTKRAEGVERFYEPKPKLVRALRFIRFFGQCDLLLLGLFVYLRILWMDITYGQNVMMLFHIIHIFSWAATITATSQLTDLGFLFMCVAIYMLSLFIDVAALIWRSFLDPFSTAYLTGVFVFNIVFIVIDISLFILFWLVLSWTKGFKDSIVIGLKIQSQSNLQLEFFTMVHSSLIFSWHSVRLLAFIEIFTLLLMILFYGLGLSMSETFSLLLMLNAPHAFLWVISLGIASRLRDETYIAIISGIYITAFSLDMLALVWRILILIDCHMYGTFASCRVVLPFGWITAFGNLMLIIISVCQIIFQKRIVDGLQREFNRLRGHVKRRLYLSHNGLATPITPSYARRPMRASYNKTNVMAGDTEYANNDDIPIKKTD